MTVVVTRDVADRYRGFLASIMPEVATGVFYVARAAQRRAGTHLGPAFGLVEDKAGRIHCDGLERYVAVGLPGLPGGAEGIRTAMLLVMRLGDRERSGTG
jgi:hypothetical protein